MQAGNADRSRELESNRYKETGKLISICMPPCMGKTIAAVFLESVNNGKPNPHYEFFYSLYLKSVYIIR